MKRSVLVLTGLCVGLIGACAPKAQDADALAAANAGVAAAAAGDTAAVAAAEGTSVPSQAPATEVAKVGDAKAEPAPKQE